MVQRGELAPIISDDRSEVIGMIVRRNDAIHDALADYGAEANAFDEELRTWRSAARARGSARTRTPAG